MARRRLRELPETIEQLTERLAHLSADLATAAAHAGDPIKIGNRTGSREGAVEALADRLEDLPLFVTETRRIPLGVYRGLRFGVILHPRFAPDAYVEGRITRTSMLNREHQGPRAILNAVERLASGYGSECERVRQELAIAEAQLRDYRERLGKPFPHDNYLNNLAMLRDQLKDGLSAPPPGQEVKEGPTLTELAAQIKELKVTNTIEAAPDRAAKRTISAEEPVTARIRRRVEAIPASDVVAPILEPLLPAEVHAPALHKVLPIQPVSTYQKRIATARDATGARETEGEMSGP
jgi:hypothetical protein